jgi:hypothetical protein
MERVSFERRRSTLHKGNRTSAHKPTASTGALSILQSLQASSTCTTYSVGEASLNTRTDPVTPPSNAAVKNEWSYTPLPHTPSKRGAWLGTGTLLQVADLGGEAETRIHKTLFYTYQRRSLLASTEMHSGYTFKATV